MISFGTDTSHSTASDLTDAEPSTFFYPSQRQQFSPQRQHDPPWRQSQYPVGGERGTPPVCTFYSLPLHILNCSSPSLIFFLDCFPRSLPLPWTTPLPRSLPRQPRDFPFPSLPALHLCFPPRKNPAAVL